MSPVPYTWAHFRLKFSSKSGFVKLTLYSPPTSISILYLTSPTVALTGGVKEGKLKKKRESECSIQRKACVEAELTKVIFSDV